MVVWHNALFIHKKRYFHMQKQREHWGSQLGFVLAAAGSAIGLGTLWKFPYVTGQNGGGLFVLIYVLCTFLIGIPIFFAELVLGRRSQRGAVGTFVSLAHNSTVWKTAGWLGVISSFLIMSFYSVIAGWGLNYAIMSLNQFYVGRSPNEIAGIFDTLHASGDISLFWHFGFTALTVAFVLPGIRQGIEYWSKFMTTALLILLVALCSYTVTLDGFPEAVRFIFTPDFTKFKPSGVLEALGLSFFTLSLGQGIMLTYGSYMRRHDNIPKTGLIIAVMIILVALLSSLVIFPIIFTFGLAPEGGAGLVFKTLPVLFAQLPGALLISSGFFILFVFTALTSSIALVEVVAANFIDLLGWSRRKAVLVVGVACALFGIPSALSGSHTLFANWQSIYGKTFFDTVNDLTSVWFLPIGGLLIALFTGWSFDKEMCRQEFQSGTGPVLRWMWRPWLFFMRWIVPIAIILIILQTGGLIDIDALVKRF
jgi:NSS family neurotransmitter:Na+ symporter